MAQFHKNYFAFGMDSFLLRIVRTVGADVNFLFSADALIVCTGNTGQGIAGGI
jgi:hypothetical protein